MSFVQRIIQISFDMASGNYQTGGSSGGNSATVVSSSNAAVDTSGTSTPMWLNTTNGGPPYDVNIPRISARIEAPAGQKGMTLSAAIWGMPLSVMNQLSVVGQQFNAVGNNKVSVSAGDALSGIQNIFEGNIMWAAVDAQSQPQVCFRVEAVTNGAERAKNEKPTTQKGAIDASQLFGQLAGKIGVGLKNLGVSGKKVRNPYLYGSAVSQIKQLAQHTGVEHLLDRGQLKIWIAGKPAGGSSVISPQTGMVGYPTFSQMFIIVRKLFDASIENPTTITVQSDLTPACGQWQTVNVVHEIESNMPKGKWFTIITAGPLGTNPSPSSQ